MPVLPPGVSDLLLSQRAHGRSWMWLGRHEVASCIDLLLEGSSLWRDREVDRKFDAPSQFFKL